MSNAKRRKHVRTKQKPDGSPSSCAASTHCDENTSPRPHRKIEFDHEQYLNGICESEPDIKNEIDCKIGSIRDIISHLDPKELLWNASSIERLGDISDANGTRLVPAPSTPSRPTEYIQSIIVSQELHQREIISQEEAFSLCNDVLKEIEELHDLLLRYLFAWSASLVCNGQDKDLSEYIFDAQLMYFVRGKRYQRFQEEYYKNLLSPHSEVFERLYGISSENLLRGFQDLAYALTQGKIDALERFANCIQQLDQATKHYPDAVTAAQKQEMRSLYFSAFSAEQCDVKKVTDWPDSFIRRFSYAPGETSWPDPCGDYCYWPITHLPVQDRPFIRVDNSYYCFDYYTLTDNFYRDIQRMVVADEPSYQEEWNRIQTATSEGLASELFSDLLPGCKCLTNNYYGNKKTRCENDLIVIYRDVLLVVEVKASAFVRTPPLTDYQAHIASYKKMIEEADSQCERTIDYLRSCKKFANLFDSTGRTVASIDLDKVSDIFALSVTVDNINEFAARAERLSFLNLKCGAISISIDDLMVYRDYFESPFVFLHFLRQRREASHNRELALNDELDHLGMYIEYNCYSKHVDGMPRHFKLFFEGFHEDLDDYFQSPIDGSKIKPQQEYPPLLHKILDYLVNSSTKNPVELSSYLLDLDDETRRRLCDSIQTIVRKQAVTARQTLLHFSGNGPNGAKLSVFVNQPGLVNPPSFDENKRLALSLLVANDETDRRIISFSFDKNREITSIETKNFTQTDISEDERASLLAFGMSNGNIRVERYISEHGKPGRNDWCPCGSGKKYKKCHGQ